MNTNVLLTFWKDLAELFQKQVELLEKILFGEVTGERNNWPLKIQYMTTSYYGTSEVNMTSSEVVHTRHHILRFLRRSLVLKIKPNTGQKIGNLEENITEYRPDAWQLGQD